MPDGTGTTGYYAALRKLPGVAFMSSAALLTMALPREHASPDLNVNVIGSYDAAPRATADRVRVIAGTLFDPADSGDAMVDSQLAAREHLVPGSTLHLLGIRGAMSNAPDLAHPVRLTFRVTAIVAFDDQVVPSGPVYSEPRVLLTPAFAAFQDRCCGVQDRRVCGRPASAGERARLSFERQAKQGPEPVGTGPSGSSPWSICVSRPQIAGQQAIRPQVIALAAFALLAGLSVLAVIGQLLSRQVTLDAAEFPILRAPRHVAWQANAGLADHHLNRTGTGAVLAVEGGIAASPLMPIGLPGSPPSRVPASRSIWRCWAAGSRHSRCCRSGS